MNHLSMLFLLALLTALIILQIPSPGNLYAADEQVTASKAEEPRRVSRGATMKLQAAPADRAVLQPTTLDDAIDDFLSSATYSRAQSAVGSGNAEKIELSISITPGETAGGSCVCSGGKGELDGKPITWPCDCDPTGCGSCGGYLSH